MLGAAASAGAHHADAVRIVHHQAAFIFILDSYYLRQVGQVAFHAEDAVHNHQSAGGVG